MKVVSMPLSGKELLRLMERHGWKLDRIRGSHHIMHKPGFPHVSVPVHGGKDLPRPLLAALLKQAGLKENA